MPAMSTVLDQAYNAIDRKLFAMSGLSPPWVLRHSARRTRMCSRWDAAPVRARRAKEHSY
jgi:hypothetical protein